MKISVNKGKIQTMKDGSNKVEDEQFTNTSLKTISLFDFKLPENQKKNEGFFIIIGSYADDNKKLTKIQNLSDFFLTAPPKAIQESRKNTINSLDPSVTITMILNKLSVNNFNNKM